MIIIASYSNVSVTYTADGTQTVFSFPFDYLRKAFVYVEVNETTVLVQGTDYSVSQKTVVFTTAPADGTKLRIYRQTDTTRLVSWADASVLRAKDMTIQQVQELHLWEENRYWVQENAIIRNGHQWNARNFPIKNVGDPVDAKDAVNKAYADSNFMKLDDAGDSWEGRGLPVENIATPGKVKDATTKEYVDNLIDKLSVEADRYIVFNTVAAMKTADLPAGYNTRTLGYHDINDGGAGTYSIRGKVAGETEDGGSVIFLANGNVAELITDGTVNVKQFGAKGDGTTDDSRALLNACAAVPKENGVLFFPQGIYIHGDGTTTGVSYPLKPGTDKTPDVNSQEEANVGRDIRMIFTSYTNLLVYGESAEIRSNDNNGECSHNSMFKFYDCDGLIIRGLKLNGRRQQRGIYLNDLGTYAMNQRHNLLIFGCNNVVVEDVVSINSAMDGICVSFYSATQKLTTNIVLRNCDFSSAHRNDVTLDGVNGAIVDSCVCNYAGVQTNGVGGTAPCLGIDVESDGGADYPNLNITIQNSTFVKNRLYELSISKYAENVTVQNCYFEHEQNVYACIYSTSSPGNKGIRILNNKLLNGSIQLSDCDVIANNLFVRDANVFEDSKIYNFLVAYQSTYPVLVDNNVFLCIAENLRSGIKARCGFSIDNTNLTFTRNKIVNPISGYSGQPLSFTNVKEMSHNTFELNFSRTGYSTVFQGYSPANTNNLSATGKCFDNTFTGFTFTDKGNNAYNNYLDLANRQEFGYINSAANGTLFKFNNTHHMDISIRSIGYQEPLNIAYNPNDADKKLSVTGNANINVAVYVDNEYNLYVKSNSPYLDININLRSKTNSDIAFKVENISDVMSIDTVTDVSSLTSVPKENTKDHVYYNELTATTSSAGTINWDKNYTNCKGVLSAISTNATYLIIPFYNSGNGTWAFKVFDSSMNVVSNTSVTIKFTYI